jgi:hypothetical protein
MKEGIYAYKIFRVTKRHHFSYHGLARMAQREFTVTDVRTIVRLGRTLVLSDGKLLVSLEPTPFTALDSSGALLRLQDCSVVLTVDGVVVTVYRNDERCPRYWTTIHPA